jgi:predicted dehydrogenase
MSGIINLAIIGKNFGNHVHRPAFASIKNVNVIGVYSKNWQDIINDKNIDAISIATPPNVAYSIIKAAIENNKHIFCEKPLAANLTEATDIKNILNDKIINAIDFEICEARLVKKIKDLINNKYLGEIKSFSFSWLLKNKYNKNSWKLDINKGGGIINNYGSHIFNLIEYIFSDQIQNIYGKVVPRLGTNTIAYIVAEFKVFSGTIHIDTDTNIPSSFILNIICDEGTVLLSNKTNNLNNFTLEIQNKANGSSIIDREDDISEIDGRIMLVRSVATKFINGIRESKQMHPNIYDGWRVQFLIDKVLNPVNK